MLYYIILYYMHRHVGFIGLLELRCCRGLRDVEAGLQAVFDGIKLFYRAIEVFRGLLEASQRVMFGFVEVMGASGVERCFRGLQGSRGAAGGCGRWFSGEGYNVICYNVIYFTILYYTLLYYNTNTNTVLCWRREEGCGQSPY